MRLVKVSRTYSTSLSGEKILFWPVLRILDVYPGSQKQIFPSRISGRQYPGSVSSIFTQKTVAKLSEIRSKVKKHRIPDPQLWFCLWHKKVGKFRFLKTQMDWILKLKVTQRHYGIIKSHNLPMRTPRIITGIGLQDFPTT
jgi:hypothetical protein